MAELGAEPFPKLPLYSAFALIAAALLVTAYSRLSPHPASYAGITPTAERSLIFNDQPDGGILVRDAVTKGIVNVVPPESNGFVRGAMRGLAQERKRRGLDGAVPFRLSYWPDGHLTLTDPAIGRSIELGAFGPANLAAFAHFLTDPETNATEEAAGKSTAAPEPKS